MKTSHQTLFFPLLSFASLTWYQSAARGREKKKKKNSGFPLRRRLPALRRRHPQPSLPCLLGVISSSSTRRRSVYSSPICLLVLGVYSASSRRNRPASLHPAVAPSAVLPAPSRRLTCAQPPSYLRPAAVLPVPSRRLTCAQQSGTPSRAVCAQSPSYVRPAVRHVAQPPLLQPSSVRPP